MDGTGFRSIVLAGGGNRCAWQVGFWQAVAEKIPRQPDIWVGVSAGAAMAALILSNRIDFAMDFMIRETSANQANFYIKNLFQGQPAFPHPDIYRRAIVASLSDGCLDRIKTGPELRVLMARPPAWAGPVSGTLLGFACYVLEKHTSEPLHPKLAAKAGFEPLVVRLNDCPTPEEAAEVILASSCTPPLLPPMHLNGRPVLDGGLIDNVPVSAIRPGEDPTLVLLSRRYDPAKLTGHPGRVYIQPSQDCPVSKWDYTDPEGLKAVFELGQKDGRKFIKGGPAALQN